MTEHEWRTWLLFVFTSNTQNLQALSDDGLRAELCRRWDYVSKLNAELLAALRALYDMSHAGHYDAMVETEEEAAAIFARARAAIANSEGDSVTGPCPHI